MTNSSKRETLFLILTSLFSAIVIISNLVAVKLVKFPFIEHVGIPCGLLIFPITFLIGDLVTEIYGEAKARKIIYVGFSMSLLSCAFIQLSILIPPHASWVSAFNPFGFEDSVDFQNAYQAVLGLNSFTVLSSMAAYILSQLLDIRLFSFFKELTHSRHLWLRNSASTLTSQIIDTLVVNMLVLYCGLKLELNAVIQISLYCYLFKTAFTLTNIPVFYAAVWGAKKYLGELPDEQSSFLQTLRWKLKLG